MVCDTMTDGKWTDWRVERIKCEKDISVATCTLLCFRATLLEGGNHGL